MSVTAIYRQLTSLLVQKSVAIELVPAGPTIAELEKKATDREDKANKAADRIDAVNTGDSNEQN